MPSSEHTPRWPWSLWLFSLIMVLISVYNLLLAFDHVRHAAYYRDLGVSYPPLLRAAFALVWGVVFLMFGIGMARRKPCARRWLLILLSNYGLFGVLWLMVFARSDFGRGRIAFHAVLTAVLIVLAAWIMRWRRMRWPFQPPSPVNPGEEFHDRSQD